MANIYVRSTTGSDANGGTSWADAKATLAGANAIAAAGDTIWISQAHSESTASVVTISTPGTITNPVRILCGNDSTEPPTSLATSAQLATTGNSNFNITGYAIIYGLQITAGDSTGTSNIQILQGYVDSCDFFIRGTGGSSLISLGNTDSVTLRNCRFKFSASTQGISHVSATAGNIKRFLGCSALSGGTSPGFISHMYGDVLFSGCDFSNWSSSVCLHSQINGPARVIFRNCKLPASWSGTPFQATPTTQQQRVEMYNCDSGDTNYRFWIQDYFGQILNETTLVKSGGASDGTTPLAWKMVSSFSSAVYPYLRLRSGEIVRWNETVGSAITVTVDILHDSATNLKDDEAWLNVEYLGTSGFPLSLFVQDSKADILATAADQAGSSASWTTTGMSNPNKQQLSVTFTPQEKGFIHASVFLGKASYTMYVDPLLQVS